MDEFRPVDDGHEVIPEALEPAELRICKGLQEVSRMEIKPGEELLIGRGPLCQVFLDDKALSRRHCSVVFHETEGLLLKDHASSNGTFLNGQKISTSRLKGGDQFVVGPYLIAIQTQDGQVVLNLCALCGVDLSIEIATGQDLMDTSGLLVCPTCSGAITKLPEIPGYELQDQIGKGEMGAVYRGIQTGMARACAIKILDRHLAHDPREVKRFFDAGNAGSELHHPNIAQVFGAGIEGEYHFITTELMDGGTLAKRIRKSGPFELKQGIEIWKQIAQAIELAHESGVLHRGLRPGNIMLTAGDIPKVVDFGLDRSFLGNSKSSGGDVWTLAHAPPEQFSDEEEVGRYSDIYGLGATLYTMLSGVAPFGGNSTSELFKNILMDTPESVTVKNPAIPKSLDRVFRKSLAKPTGDRYGNVNEMVDAVKEALDTPSAEVTPAPEPRSSVDMDVEDLFANVEDSSATEVMNVNVPPAKQAGGSFHVPAILAGGLALQSVKNFGRDISDFTQETFIRTYPHPFLVFDKFKESDAVLPWDGTIAGGTDTDKHQLKDLVPGTGKVCPLFLKTADGGQHQIIIGRVNVANIQIEHGQVSKMHAVIRRERGIYVVEDTGSTNGTKINNKKLEPGQPVPITNLDALSLGGAFQATFFTPDGMYNYLQFTTMNLAMKAG